jgi:hypothetical protein
MLSWFRRASPAKAILGLADDPNRANDLASFADGLGVGSRLRLHGTAERLWADPGFHEAPLLLLAVQHPALTADALAVQRQRAGGAPGEVAVLTDDPLEQIALRDLDAGRAAGILRIRPLSRAREAARATFAAAALPDRVLRFADPNGGIAVTIAGEASFLASELVLELLRLVQLPELNAAITLAGPGMPALLAHLREALPEFDSCGQVTALPLLTPAAAPPALIIITENDTSVPGPGGPHAQDPAGLAPIVRPEWPSWRDIGRAQADPARDHVARAIHGLYLEERLAGGQKSDQPSQRRWEDLPERFREASRHQAAHIFLKLRWAGVRASDPTTKAGDGTATFGWTERELYLLSHAEHDRWAAAARLEGWRFAANRDDSAKTSPLLVPFAALTPEVKDYDKLPVRAIPHHLGVPLRRDVIATVESIGDPPGLAFATRCQTALRDLNARLGGRLVLRITAVHPLTVALAKASRAVQVPIQLALDVEPAPSAVLFLEPDFCKAERIAIGAAVRHLPAATERLLVGGDGTLTLNRSR